jgi:hypothetical protein
MPAGAGDGDNLYRRGVTWLNKEASRRRNASLLSTTWRRSMESSRRRFIAGSAAKKIRCTGSSSPAATGGFAENIWRLGNDASTQAC